MFFGLCAYDFSKDRYLFTIMGTHKFCVAADIYQDDETVNIFQVAIPLGYTSVPILVEYCFTHKAGTNLLNDYRLMFGFGQSLFLIENRKDYRSELLVLMVINLYS